MNDLTEQFNTPLTPEEQQAYEAWAKAGGRDPREEQYDYDLPGYYKSVNGAPLGEGHLTDTFKKPNHPTFSDQSKYHDGQSFIGGQWQQRPDGSYNFVPGRTNVENWGPQGLHQYFQKFEPGNTVQIPEGL